LSRRRLAGRLGSGGIREEQVYQSLIEKRDAIYGFITSASEKVGTAHSNAAAVLKHM
jgi:hypothetical protein